MIRIAALFLFAILTDIAPVFAQSSTRFSDIKPGMYEEQLEARAIKIANERAVNCLSPERYTKAVILSYKWRLELDRQGYVTGRKIHIELYCERPGGRCGRASFTFREKYDGVDDFSNRLFFVSNGEMYTEDCE